MKTMRLGCLSRTGILSVVVTLILIGGVGLARGGVLFSPGELNDQKGGTALGGVFSHAETEGRCAACHAAFWSGDLMSDRCLDCHVNLLEGDKNFHNIMMAQGQVTACQSCHTDHNGNQAVLTKSSLDDFPHSQMGFSLEGHQIKANGVAFACRDCHGEDFTQFDPAICQDCHQEIDVAFMSVHGSAFGSDCLACHDGVDRYTLQFDHQVLSFPLEGEHQNLACEQCHAGARSPADLQDTPQECVACHQEDDIHNERFGQDCASCHTPQGWKGADFDHSLAAFDLIGAHVDVACDACHLEGSDGTVYQGTPTECFACHSEDDEHQGSLGTNCAQCHSTASWEDVNFDHSLASFALTGTHTEVACSDCHVEGPSGTIYKGTPTNCFSCHSQDDEHRGSLGTDCAQCHNTSSWEDANFDHSRSVFALTGAHTDVACSACHVESSSGTIYKGTPTDCFACHAGDDEHEGSFGTDCAQCHNTRSWEDADFDHSRAAFPLTGAHVSVSCNACHQQGQFKGTPTTCYACHAGDDEHDGRFGTDCAQCHNTSDWEDADFDHSLASFALTGAHVNVSCNQCHQQGQFKGTPAQCVACHAEPVFHQGLFNADCTACHNTGAWTPAKFNQAHRFPINHGDGGGSDCQTCHPNSLRNYTCYSCHEHSPAKIESEHREEGISDFQNCTRCHPTGREEEGGGSEDGGNGGEDGEDKDDDD